MFVELLCASYERYRENIDDAASESEPPKGGMALRKIRITVYHAQKMDYPQTSQEWDGFDGIIIPGSLSAAYDTHIEWIHRLLSVIQTEIHEKRRKTLGVCFGHQCFAHSFRSSAKDSDHSTSEENDDSESNERGDGGGGLATECCIGPMAGRRAFRLTAEGKFLLGGTTTVTSRREHQVSLRNDLAKNNYLSSPKEYLEMLYTRVGISLCGDDNLPNEACAYFASEEDAMCFRNCVAQDTDMDSSASACLKCSKASWPQPYAITYQAHPEFMSDTGYKVNFINTVSAMEKRGSIHHETSRQACEDADSNYNVLLENCLNATISTGVTLGWFK
ncbi:hypothetical protein ACHAW5_004205 [Stephanodiscus triporus]|uniref:Glutamine amidotransferase domain-containing protein n=1 Tax=Stephanodiscus triporus TaxID=2934178 RepID=A0ABD3PS40_9STRA